MALLEVQDQFRRMVTGYWVSQMLYVAAKLGLADHVKDGPCAVDELAKATGTHAPSLFRLMRALASIGVFAQDDFGRFSLTPLAECLQTGGPSSQRSLTIMLCEEHYGCFGRLLDGVRTGEMVFDKIYDAPIFDYLSKHPEQSRTFDEAMVDIHGRETLAMLDAYDFSTIGTLADVGGGNGSLLAAVLKKYSKLRGMLVDLPSVTEHAGANLQAAGVLDRCQIVSGSFFEAVPPGADAYLMRHIIHDWDDQKSTTILKNVHRALAGKGKLLLVEGVIQAGNDPSFIKLLDLVMLLIPGGKERTKDEFEQLFTASGFRLNRIVPTASEINVIEALPV